MSQLEKSLEPLQLGVAKGLDIDPCVRSTDDSTDGHDDDVQQFVGNVIARSRIIQL
jgi:hypothetical protein